MVLTVESLEGEVLEDYSLRVAESWAAAALSPRCLGNAGGLATRGFHANRVQTGARRELTVIFRNINDKVEKAPVE